MRRLLHSSWLDSHFNLEAIAGKVEGLSLDRAKRLAGLVGNPQREYPSLHLTGTNGKGSTAHILTRLLMAVGLKVGTYSSPHIKTLNERFKINDQPIPDRDLDEILETLKETEENSGEVFSWFELATAVAFLWFQKNQIDVAVVEVGKLGRYDATNIIDSKTAIVTNISKDHTEGLDIREEWERAIAFEKAGIVRKGGTLILGNITQDLKEIFLSENPEEIYCLGIDFHCVKNEKTYGGRKLDITSHISDGKPEKYKDLFLSMHGAHQGENAAIALAAAKIFLKSRSQPCLLDQKAIASAFAGVGLPGRYEIVSENPLLIIDGGHNPDGALAASLTLKDFLADRNELWENSTLIFGITKEKNTEEMLDALNAKAFSSIICTSLPIQRGKDPYELADTAVQMGLNPVVEVNPKKALKLAMDSDLIFVCGSLYLAGAV